jgi:hypothetical protein
LLIVILYSEFKSKIQKILDAIICLTPASADVKRGAVFAAFSLRKNCDAFYGQLQAIVIFH